MTLTINPMAGYATGNPRYRASRYPASPGTWFSLGYEPAMFQSVQPINSGSVNPELMEGVRARLNEIANLPSGWDGGSAVPIAPTLIEIALEFISADLISKLATKPDVVPTVRGGLQIEWHNAQVDLIIELAVSGSSFYFCDSDSGLEVEAPIGEKLNDLAGAFAKLGFNN